MNSLALSFNEVNLKPLPIKDGQVWVGVTQIGLALGYANPETAITKIFNRKSDEFTSDMTRLVEVQTNGGVQQVRVFSLRGAHLIAIFARTPVAKEFRKWVLDVLENEIQHQQIDTRVKINAGQQAELKEIVDRRCRGIISLRTELWSRHNRHFRIPRYSELLAIHFQDAVDYLETMELKSGTNIVIEDNQSLRILCTHSKLFMTWWRTHSPALGKLNPQLVYMLNDNMFYMSCAIDDLCKKYAIELPAYDYQRMFLLETESDKRFRLIG
ncbi:BRO-N domain-containing protein [Acinetobacter chinensis]|uniref:BRO-N domain-containing protein n=1 Tax=Acinetobacter chinensis TaxID=2004650 RepID=UPI002934E4B2|nr:Bro-N domain-containing protein [Acinetobacter chinensis]WOE43097.1 Bro-N domain-containing protein [Acinetobacter chinensis]